MKNIMENLNDPVFCRAVVLSLRTYLEALGPNHSERNVRNIEQIAYGKCPATRAFIELDEMK